MKKKFLRRIATIVAATAIGAGALCMFAGCTSNHPEVTITYSFNDEDYAVTYTLSRSTKPETTQHFIELADAGFYDGTVVHSYDANYLHAGAYTLGEEGELVEKDYFSFVKEYEQDHDAFTQSVFKVNKDGNQRGEPLYTVVGEFYDNSRSTADAAEYGGKGSLAMCYPDIDPKSVNFRYNVYVERADGGDDNDGQAYDIKDYRYNSATSRFYTFFGESDGNASKYAVFGKVKDFSGEMQPLLDAISAYSDTLPEDETFTTSLEDMPRLYLFSLAQGSDPDFDALRRSGAQAADYHVPLKKPILIRSVTVDQY